MTVQPLIVDAHQDLAWNMRTFGRDYTRSASETRRLEQGTGVPIWNGDTLLGWPEYQRGRVAVVFASLFAAPARCQDGEWDTECYRDLDQANRLYRAQVENYHRLAGDSPDYFRLIPDRKTLLDVLRCWEDRDDADPNSGRSLPDGCPVGLVLSMENAEGVRSPVELDEWWELGVRIIGPAWTGTIYCGGTGEPGPLTREGYALLDGMASLGFGLDLSHMDEKAALQALDFYPGTIIATHGGIAARVKKTGNRNFSDPLIRATVERDGVIGIVPANSFLLADWQSAGGRTAVRLEHIVAQIDYVCQMAGDAHHIGLGSDFDGGFGLQSVPAEIDTIADLQKLVSLLLERGYTEMDVAAVMGGNWLSILERILPLAS